MYIAVQHTIHDPAGFWAGTTDPNLTIPAELTLHHTFPTSDGGRAICIWEAASIAALRDFLEPATSKFCKNDYFAVENKSGFATPSALQPA
jgi:hypothetical protein